MSTALHRLKLPDQTTDADLLAQLKRGLRDAEQAAALVISGSFAGNVTDVKAHRDMIGLLLDASIPVIALPYGLIGQRGLALLLAADHIVLGPDASTTIDWRTSPGLAPLLHHRLGSTSTGAIIFDPSADLLARAVDHGLAVRASDPDARVQEIAAALGGGIGRRLKRALKAAGELSLKEAVGFDLWFAKPQPMSAP
jgi:enoyl-CoA hydratase/carnithine racemase